MSTVLTEGLRPAEFYISEANGGLSRELVTVASGADLLPGTVVGKVSQGATTAVAAAGGSNAANTGVLTLDGTTPTLANVQAGVYTATCTATASNSGTFRVTDPTGDVLGDVTVGQTFANQIKFSISDGTTDFSVGEKFTVTVTVAAGSGKVKKLAPSATDGSQIAYGVVMYPAEAATADVEVTAFVRNCEVAKDRLVWPSGITDPQKAAALADLEKRGVVAR